MANKYILPSSYKEKISEKELYGAYKIFFGTLVSHSRLEIINLLRKSRKNVSEIVKELNMNQTTASHDLARLKRCGFVKSERKGAFIYYALNQETIRPLLNIIERHMSAYCVHILHTMKEGHKRK